MSYHVLQANGYPDTKGDYVTVATKRDVAGQLIDLGYLDNPAMAVYAGDREPWTEMEGMKQWTSTTTSQ